jgi:hypothetical protein
MRVFAFSAILAVLVPFSGCENQPTPPASPPATDNRPSAEVHTRNVDVHSDRDGTRVRTPGADVQVEKKQP